MTKLNTATNPYPSEEEFYKKKNTKVSRQDLQRKQNPDQTLQRNSKFMHQIEKRSVFDIWVLIRTIEIIKKQETSQKEIPQPCDSIR